MSIRLLKQLIKETIEHIDEVDESDVVGGVPTTFNAFRKIIVASMKACGAGPELTSEIEDLDYAAGETVQLVHDAWSSIEVGLRSRDKRGEWENGVDYFVRNVMLHVAAKDQSLDPDDFADQVVEHILSKLDTCKCVHHGLP